MSTVQYIIGAYPSAPSFHYANEADETEFFRLLAAKKGIAGLEQPCLEHFHPLGNEYLFKTIPGDWKIVITAIMYTMGRRGKEPGFGLASTDEDGRRAAVKYHQHIAEQMTEVRSRYGQDRFLALQIQSAPLKGETNVSAAADAFAKSLKDLEKIDFGCELVIEHCDAFNSGAPAVRKGFLPLDTELALAGEYGVGLCVNWARSVLEDPAHSPARAVEQVKLCRKAGLLSGLMFSGTATGGSYGAFEDNHAPFAPFKDCRVNCPESLMTVGEARKCIREAGDNLTYLGAKLLECNAAAPVRHRAELLLDAVDAMNLACAK